jgi:integrase-like protein/transposase IS116/IS110/IS902 family protein
MCVNAMNPTPALRLGGAGARRVHPISGGLLRVLGAAQNIDAQRYTRSFARDIGLEPRTTPIESSESNGIAEAFVRTIKRDYVRVSPRPNAETVMRKLPSWISHYNEVHPHKALGYRSPREFRSSRKSLTVVRSFGGYNILVRPGGGSMEATAIAATVPDPKVFRSGRDFAAWIEIVPRQDSTKYRRSKCFDAEECERHHSQQQ